MKASDFLKTVKFPIKLGLLTSKINAAKQKGLGFLGLGLFIQTISEITPKQIQTALLICSICFFVFLIFFTSKSKQNAKT